MLLDIYLMEALLSGHSGGSGWIRTSGNMFQDLRLSKPLQSTGLCHASIMADGVGFEPTRACAPNSFQDCGRYPAIFRLSHP